MVIPLPIPAISYTLRGKVCMFKVGKSFKSVPFVIVLAIVSNAHAATTQQVPASCPVTYAYAQQSTFAPPPPFPIQPASGYYFGSERLWTALFRPVWSDLPHSKDGYRQKIAWWSKDYASTSAPVPTLIISGRRLDENASFTGAPAHGGFSTDMGTFISSMVTLPTAGCWEITGRLGDDQLKFVVWVAE
jgi:hypothetical protein